MGTNQLKAIITAVASTLSSILGVLFIPVLLMVLCNIIDYATGLMAACNRNEKISARKGFKGIIKKVAMWLLVLVGVIIDQLLIYSTETFGIALPFTFLVACIIAIWIICNELISILENVIDIGVSIPGFLMPLVKHIKGQVDDMTENVTGSSENVLENHENVSESEEN